MLPTSGEAKIKGKKFSDRSVSDTTHANAPFRDHHLDGHDLNESYKIPAANASGSNLSYMHPLVGGKKHGNAPEAPAQLEKVFSSQTGKGKG